MSVQHCHLLKHIHKDSSNTFIVFILFLSLLLICKESDFFSVLPSNTK